MTSTFEYQSETSLLDDFDMSDMSHNRDDVDDVEYNSYTTADPGLIAHTAKLLSSMPLGKHEVTL